MFDETRPRRRPDGGRSRRGGALRSRVRRRGDDHAGEDVGAEPPREGEVLAIVGFKSNRKGFYHNRRGLDVSVGDVCLVDADRGRDLGRVLHLGEGRSSWWDEAVHQGLLAPATDDDLARVPELRREEGEAWSIGLEKIQEHALDMQLVGVERRWDRGKLTFYFLAPGRVDFRSLVRDLAGVFRTRIELRQIGVRDEARLKGGLGICGRAFCCATFLPSFASVTLRMAKDQQLPLNPGKLSGPCGRLRCCLAFENEQYRTSLQTLPKPGSEVRRAGRRGRARKIDPLKELVTVQWADDGGGAEEVDAADLEIVRPAIAPGKTETGGGDSPGADRRRGRRGGRGRRRRAPDPEAGGS